MSRPARQLIAGNVAARCVSLAFLRRTATLGLILLIGLYLASSAKAQTIWYWDADTGTVDGTGNASNGAAGGANSNTWDTTGALWWDGSYTTDAAWSSSPTNTTVAYFSGNTNTVTVGNVTAGGLIFDATSGNAFQSGATTQGYYILNGGTITLVASGANAPTITTYLNGPMGGTNPGIGTGYTQINSQIEGISGITFNGSGNVYLNGANTFTGAVTINGGGVIISAAAGLDNQAVTLNNGAFGGLDIMSTSFAYSGNLTTGATGGVIDVASGLTTTLSANLSTGAGNFSKNDRGLLVLGVDNSAQTYGGSILVNGGQIRSNSFTSTANPFGNSSANYVLNNAGSLYAQASAAATPVTLGSLTVSGGNLLEVDSNASHLDPIALTFSNLVRSGQGTLVVAGVQSQLGTANEQVFVSSFTNSTATNGIIAPWAIGNQGNGTNNPATFLNYTTAAGLIPATYTSTGTNVLQGATATTGVVDVTGTDNSLTSSKAIFALRDDGQTISANAGGPLTLTLGSGGLILNGGTIGSSTTATKLNLNFNSAEGLIYVNSNNATIDDSISGTNGITKFGSNGTLTLGYGSGDTTANSYVGTFRVNGGTISLNEAAGTNVITGPLVIGSGASLGSVTGSTGTVTLQASSLIASTSNVVINDGGVLNLNNNSNLISSLTFNGAGQVETGGSGTLTLNGNITASTSNTWNSSGLSANDYADITGTGGQNGNLNLGGATRTITVSALTLPGAINNFTQDLTIDALISNGGIIKDGSGVLTLTNTNSTFSGPVSVVDGILRLGSVNSGVTVAPNANGPLGNSSSAVSLGDSAGLNNVVLSIQNGANFERNIVVNGVNGAGGSVTIETNDSGNGGVGYSGNILLNRNVIFAVSDSNGASGLNGNNGLAGIISGVGGVTTETEGMGTGEYTINFNSAGNSWSGPTSILGGTITAANFGLSPASAVTLDSGPTGSVSMSANGNNVQIGSLANGTANGPGILTYNGNGGTWIIGDPSVAGSTTFSGPIITSSNNGVILKTGPSTQILDPVLQTGNLTFWADGGTLQLGGPITSWNGAVYNILPGGTLALDSTTNPGTLVRSNNTGNNGNTVFLGGGTISVTGNSANNTVDTFTDTFNLNSGASAIAVTPGAGETSKLSFGTMARNTGSTVVFSGPSLGAATGSNVSQITFSSSPASITGLTTTAATILPWATGDTTPGGAGIGFVTYDTNGVRLLTSGEYTSAFTSGKNVQITASNSGPATGTTIQSLFLNNSALTTPITLSTGGATLTVNQSATGGSAGAILSIGETGANANVISAPLAFNNEAIIDTVGDLNINGTLNLNGNAFTKSGGGTLTLSSSTPLTTGNTITINAGKVILGAADAINTTNGTQVNINGTSTTLDMNGFNQVITNLGGNGNNGNNGIGAASSGGGIITNNGTSAPAVLTLNSNGNNTFYGGLQDGTSQIALVMNNSNTQTFWTNSAIAFSYSGTTTETVSGTTYTGTTFINAGTLAYHLNETGTQTVSLGASGSTVVLNGGNLEFDPMQFNAALPGPFVVGTTTYGSLVLNNAITVTSSGGGLLGETLGPTNLFTQFAGPISLNGLLTINGQNNSGANNWNEYTGTISLNNSSVAALPGLFYQQNGSSYQSVVNSVIQNGTLNANLPLTLRAALNGNTFTLTGVSTYTSGTIIQGAEGVVNLIANGQSVGTPSIIYNADAVLGTGNVTIQPGGRLLLNAADNVNTAGGATIAAYGSQVEEGSLAINFNPASQSALGIAATSNGALDIATTTFNANLTMSTLGTGTMFLGATNSNGTYGGSTLGAGSGGVYRLGAGGSTLTISNAVLTGAGDSLEVGSPGGASTSFDEGGAFIGDASGQVKLNAANTYGGGTTINKNSTLEGVAQASGTPFGSTTSAMTINGGTLQLDGIGSNTTTTVGATTIAGVGKLALNDNGTNTNILSIASLQSTDSGGGTRTATAPYALAIQPNTYAQLGGREQVVLASGNPGVTNGMAAPYFFETDGNNTTDFLTYGATGFAKATYTSVAANGLAGSGTTNANNIVDLGGNQTLNASDNVTVYALHNTVDPVTISTASATINITSGGFTSSHDNNTDNIAPALVFGTSATPVEAVVNIGRNNQTTNFNGAITAAGLTKLGLGNLNLGAANTITGQISILAGTLTYSNANQLGAVNGPSGNVIYLDGGALWAQNTPGTLEHNIVLGPGGGSFAGGSNGYLFQIDGAISGPGMLTKYSGGSANLTLTNANNTYSGGTLVTGNTLTVTAGSSVGTGDLATGGSSGNGGIGYGTVILQGNANVASTAQVSVYAGSIIDFQSTAPAIGSLDGSGSVVLGNTGSVVTNLTIGGNSATTLFDGAISQASGAGASGINKVGTGTMTLAGVNTYTGSTTINAGSLRVTGSVRGTGTGSVVSVGGVGATNTPTLSGTGSIAGPVTVFGSAGGSTIGTITGTSGATFTLTGGLTLNNLSMSSFALTSGGVSNGTALITTSGGVGGNSLLVDVGNSGVNTINLSGTAAIGTYDLISFTGTGPASSNFVIGTNTISTPNLSFAPEIIGQQLDLVVSSAVTLTWVGGGTSGSGGIWDNTGAAQSWATNAPAASGFLPNANVVFNDTDVLPPSGTFSSTQTVNITGPVGPSSVVFNNTAVAYILSGVGSITGNTGLTLTSTGTVTIENSNSFTGPVSVGTGTLNVQNSGALGNSSLVSVASGGTLQLQGAALAIPALPLNIVGNGTGSGALQNVSGNNSYAGLITLTGPANITSSTASNTLTLSGGVATGSGNALTISGAGNTSITAPITGSGNLTYSDVGGALLTLSVASPSYSGTVQVNSGTLRVTNASGSATGTGPVFIGGASDSLTPTLTGGGTIGGSLTIAGTSSPSQGHIAPSGFTGSSGTTLNLTGALTLNTGSDLDFNLSNSPSSGNDQVSVTGSGAVNYGTGGVLNINAGAGGLSAGTYTLIGDASSVAPTGGTSWGIGSNNDSNGPSGNDLNNYSISVGGVGGQNLDLVVTTTAISWNGSSGSWTGANAFSTRNGTTIAYADPDAVQFGDTYPTSLIATAPVGANTTINIGSTVSPVSVAFNANSTPYTLTGSGSIAGSTGLSLTGTSSVTIDNTNTFTGPVSVGSGSTLVLETSGAIGGSILGATVASSGVVQLSGTGLSVATPLALNGGALQNNTGSNSYTGLVTLTGAGTITSSTATKTLTLTGGINTGSGNLLTINGAGGTTVSSTGISGSGGLTYGGTGTLTLSATNGYSGATTVNSGTVLLSGSLGSLSAVTVGGTTASGASGTPTLVGSGTVNGSLTVFGSGAGNVAGTVAPSGGVGASSTHLNVGNGGLTLNNGAVLDFNLSDLADGTGVPTGPNGDNDYINVTGTGGLTLSGGGTLNINAYDGNTLQPGDYELVSFAGALSGSAAGWNANGPAGFTYSFTVANSNQFDLVVSTGSSSGSWIGTNAGNTGWSVGGNWSSGSNPNGAGQSATFGSAAGSPPGLATTVTVDGNYTIGTLNIGNSSGGNPFSDFTLTSAGPGGAGVFSLTLQDTSGGAQVNVAAGSFPTLSTSLVLASTTGTTTFSVAPAGVLFVTSNPASPSTPAISNSSGTQGIAVTGGGTLELASSNTYNGPTTVTAGTLQIDSTGSIANTSSVSIATAGTLLLAGSTGALPSTVNVTTHGNGAFNLTGAATQTVGVVASGDAPGTILDSGSVPAVVYTGSTTVGDGSNAASLTVTQILQASLTIEAGSTVTIAASAAPLAPLAQSDVSDAAVASSDASADSSDSSSDPFTAIQAAIAAGSISSSKGKQLENRISAIERLATTDPGLNLSLLESKVLATIPSSSILPSTDSSPLGDTGTSMLAMDSSAFASGSSGASGAFAGGASFAGSPAAVPEPSTLLLAALGGIGLALAARRRRVNQ